jgi:hypothetical protein
MSAVPRRRWRVLAALPLIGAAALGGARVATALWSQSVPISTEEVTTGRLDLTAAIGGSITVPVQIQSQLLAPTTARVPLTIGNAGNVTLDYRLADVAWAGTPGSGTAALVPTIAPAGSAADCSAGAVGSALALTTGGSTVVSGSAFVAWRALPVGGSEVLCLSLRIPEALSASFQLGSPTITLTFTGQNQ